jgi:hypothetical protein
MSAKGQKRTFRNDARPSKLIFFRLFEHPTRITKKSGPSEGKMEDSFKIVTRSGGIGLSCFSC